MSPWLPASVHCFPCHLGNKDTSFASFLRLRADELAECILPHFLPSPLLSYPSSPALKV